LFSRTLVEVPPALSSAGFDSITPVYDSILDELYNVAAGSPFELPLDSLLLDVNSEAFILWIDNLEVATEKDDAIPLWPQVHAEFFGLMGASRPTEASVRSMVGSWSNASKKQFYACPAREREIIYYFMLKYKDLSIEDGAEISIDISQTLQRCKPRISKTLGTILPGNHWWLLKRCRMVFWLWEGRGSMHLTGTCKA
jgi:hypothetical protein